jgi:hypothetical protein
MTLSEEEFAALWSYRSESNKSDYDIVTSPLTYDEQLAFLCKRESTSVYGVDWYDLSHEQKCKLVDIVSGKYYQNEFIG